MKEQVNPMLLLPFPVKDNQTPAASMLSAERRRQTKSLAHAVLAVLFLAAVTLMAPAGLHAQTVSFNNAQTTVGAGFNQPNGVAVDGAGNLFIADANNNRVVKVPASGGAQTTVGTGLNEPNGVAVDEAGNVFILNAGSSLVVKVPASGGAQTTVGTGLKHPNGVAVDGAGNVFIMDIEAVGNSRVVEVPANGGAQTTLPITGLVSPVGVAVDGAGNLFVTDSFYSHVVELPANGGAQTIVPITGLVSPYGVAVDGAGNLFIADSSNNRVVKVPGNGGAQITVLATGLNDPVGVAVDGTGNVFIADYGNNRVVKLQYNAVNLGGVNVCPAGQNTPAPCSQTATLSYTVNAAATIGSVNVVTQGAPNLDFTLGSTTCTGTQTAGSSCTVTVKFAPTVAGLRAGAVQIVDGSGNVLATTPVYGTGEGPQIAFDSGAPPTVLATGPSVFLGVAVDGAGNAYVVDSGNNQVVKIAPDGVQTPLITGLILPWNVAVDGAGDVFVTNTGYYGQVIEITPAGVQTIAASGLNQPTGIAVDGAGDLFIADAEDDRVVEIRPSGVQTTLATGLNNPAGIAVDGAGNVFIADTNNNRIVEVPAGGTQTVVPVSGLNSPQDVKVDAAGDLFIADFLNLRVVEWSAAGVQTTVPASGVSDPHGLALDGAGDLFVTNYARNLVEVLRSQPPVFNFAATTVGTTSGDSPQSVTVENIGNGTLSAIAPGLSIGANFAQVDGSGTPADCTAVFSLAPGSSCNLSISFTPTAGGSIQSSAILTDNALNANPATQSIQLTGTGNIVTPTITFTIPDQTYGVASVPLNAASNSPGAITYSVVAGPATVSGNGLTITGTGHVTVQAQQAASEGYNPATARTSFTVNPATLTVTAADATRVYGASNPDFTYTITGYMNGDTSSVISGTPQLTTTAITGSAPGTYPINVQRKLNAANYNFTYVNGTLTVTQASQTINFAALPNVTYGAASIPLSATASSGRPVTYTVTGPATLLSNGSTLTVTGAGTVAVTANQTGDQNYTAATAITQSFTVSPATLTVTANNVSRAYGAANPNLNYGFSGFVHGDNSTVISGTATVATAATTTSAPGTYPVTFSAEGLTSPNYNFTYVNGTLTVTQASQTISFTALPNVTYGVSPITLAATASSGLAAAYTVTGPATLTGSTLTVTGTGTVAVTANQTGNPNYTAATAVTQSFTVSPATLTVTPNPVTQPYGATNPTLAYTVTGFVKGDTLSLVTGSATVTTTATTTSAPGTYPISFATEGLTAANYNFNYVNGTLTVTQASQTINFAPLPNVTYGASPITLAATASSGQAVAYTVTGPATVAGSTLTVTGAGTVAVTANQAGNTDYNAANAVTHSFIVSQAALTITANSVSRAYGAANPAFNYTVTGLVNGDSSTLVQGTATLTTTATATSAPGTYPISFATEGLTATNYSFNYVSGTLTINQTSQTISFAPLSNVTYGAGPITLGATASSGLPVSYTVAGPATVTGLTLTITGTGTVTVTASQMGNPSYTAATAVTQSFSVAAATPMLTFSVPSQSSGATPFTVSATSNSSGAITYSVLSGPATISGNRVTLTGTGTVTLLASQAASGNYTAATAQASFSVSAPGAITINGGNSKLNFGVFPFGLTGTNQITFGITINNNSPATTSISAAFVNSPSNYSIVQNGCSSSHSGYSSYCQVTIGFTQPTTLAGLSQTYSGTLVFTSSNPAFGLAGGGTVTVTAGVAKVYTNAPYGTTAANPYNFGSANNGSTGASLSFQIFNPSGWNNSGAPASVSLNNYNNWNFTGGCNGYLGDNGQCASTLQFKGSYPSGQTNNGTLTIGNSSGVQVWNSDGSAVFGKLYLTGNTN